jgi:hypothetical protein
MNAWDRLTLIEPMQRVGWGNKMPKLERIHRDMQAGRLWKARDRLQGMLGTYPRSQEVMELLGDVLFRMGDWPEAGRYWFHTERNDENAQVAFHAFWVRYRESGCDKLRRWLDRIPPDELGPVAHDRANTLMERCVPRQQSETGEREQQGGEPGTRSAVWRQDIVTWASLIFLLVPWMAGLFTLALWLISLAFPSIRGIFENWLLLGC